jgi:hypothetical protein
MLGRKELGTCIVVRAREASESVNADWFGKPSNTLGPSFSLHSLVSRETLFLRIGTIMSMVG